MKIVGRFLLALIAALLVLLVGVFGAVILGGFALLERSGAHGGGFLVLEFLAIGVLICVPMAIAAACWILFRTEKHPQPAFPDRGGLFLGQ